MDILFRKAGAGDIGAIAAIYEHTHDAEEAGLTTTGWQRGIYPVKATAEAALERDDMYVAEIDGKIAAAAIINQLQVDGYEKCDWKYKAPDEEISVIHTLVVDPAARGAGLGPAFVRFWEDTARKCGCTVLRLDTNKRNSRARKMYAGMGYIETDIIPVVFNGIKGVDLVLLEKKL